MKRWSIIIPTYNRRHCVLEAVQSVTRDRGKDYEVIVVDDASTDGTEALFAGRKDRRVRYLRLPRNGGVNNARNAGVKAARGEYCVFLDSDDTLAPGALKALRDRKLAPVNFFGTAERKSRKDMFRLSGERLYSYGEWLGGEAIQGEFLAVVRRTVFRRHRFPARRFCFESFFWNDVIKEHGVLASPVILRLYSFEQENRVSLQLLNPRRAEQRHEDYVLYLERYGSDYERHGLGRAHAAVLCSAGLYALLAGRRREGRQLLRKSWRKAPLLRCAALLFASAFGTAAVRGLVSFYSSTQRV